MARGWRVLDATSFEGAIEARRGHLLLNGEFDRHEVPAAEVAVLLIGGRSTLRSSALHYATKYDIAVLAADWRGVPYCGLFPWSDHTRVAARHIAQAEMSLPRKKNAWKHLIRAKIAGQAANLAPANPSGYRRLMEMACSVRSGDPTNLEGQAARYYWSQLFDAEFAFTRDQLADDWVNPLLNYGYMVLRGFGIRAVLSAGLAPPLGVFHHGRSNYFNLVDDLIEPFRPAIDAAVVRLSSEASLEDSVVKRTLVDAATQRFTSDGYRIPAVLDDLAQQFGRYVEGDVPKLEVTTWTGIIDSPESDHVED